MAQRKVYYIPDNFVDDEKIFSGKFRKRNFIEAVIFTLPVLGLFWLINWATGIGWGTLFYPTFLFGIATFFLFIIGYNGDSWGETLLLAQKFRSNKFNISTYNPRIKTELTADYLANPNANSKAEAIRNFIKNLNDVLAGARGQSEIADDLTSDKTILWYVEDEGIIEKPESLKTAAEIKQEEKDAKKAAKLEKKKQKEYLSTLGPKERKIAKARLVKHARIKASGRIIKKAHTIQNTATCNSTTTDSLTGCVPKWQIRCRKCNSCKMPMTLGMNGRVQNTNRQQRAIISDNKKNKKVLRISAND